MIQVSRLSGKSFVINCELIKTIESTPDTVLTLSTGEKLMVKETVDEIVRMTIEYKKKLGGGVSVLAPNEWTSRP